MVLNKVPNVDDLGRHNIIAAHQWHFGGLTESDNLSAYPGVSWTAQNGGAINHLAKWAELSHDGTTSALAQAAQGVRIPAPQRGRYIVMLGFGLGQTENDTESNVEVGLSRNATFDGADCAALQITTSPPRARVDTGSSDVDVGMGAEMQQGGKGGQPDHWVVFIDINIDDGTTDFYIDDSPFSSDPDGSVNAIPGGSKPTILGAGVTVETSGTSGDSDDEVYADFGGWWWLH